jgi:hypothetical protein
VVDGRGEKQSIGHGIKFNAMGTMSDWWWNYQGSGGKIVDVLSYSNCCSMCEGYKYRIK